MLFNSIEFAIFFPIVFFIYWFILQNNLKWQNVFLLIVSYIFYGWWDWRCLSLIFLSSVIDFLIGLLLGKTENPKQRKRILLISLIFNIGLLSYFKYFNFFIESLITAFSTIGIQLNYFPLNIILPAGISFYTFQSLSYTIDIYFKKIEPTKDPVLYFTFVSFFPQLVAGPIERARDLIPQLNKKRFFVYENAKDGMRQILWGLFIKIVIADNLAPHVNEIFENYNIQKGSTLVLGAIYNSVQFYADFAGYSYIAIGIAKLLGVSLTRNFAYPFFSKNTRELWRRWHITFNTWVRDYIYYPLLNSQTNKWKKYISVNIAFLISGLWHGANWTYIVWGIVNGIYLSLNFFINPKNEIKETKSIINFLIFIKMLILFSFPMIFVRCPDINSGLHYLGNIFSVSLFSIPDHKKVFFWLILLFSWEWVKRDKEHPLVFTKLNKLSRWAVYIILIIFPTLSSS